MSVTTTMTAKKRYIYFSHKWIGKAKHPKAILPIVNNTTMRRTVLILNILAAMSLTACSNDEGQENKSLTLDDNYYEVALGDTIQVKVENGSKDLQMTSDNDGSLQTSYSYSYKKIYVIGKRIGQSVLNVKDANSNEERTATIRVTSPFIGLSFDNTYWESLGLTNLNLTFFLVANDSRDCFALYYSPARFRYLDAPFLTGQYEVSTDGKTLSFDMKGDAGEFNHSFEVTSQDAIDLFRKIPDIADETRCSACVKMKDLNTGNTINETELWFKGYSRIIPHNIIK